MALRAVVFDLGGVVVGSPLHAIAAYERDQGIPSGTINRVVVATAPGGAWSRLERGELDLAAFFPAFEADCAAHGVTMSARVMMERIDAVTIPHAGMLQAIARLRARGLKVAALTNNWIVDEGEGTGALRDRFDVFVESAKVGMRKPDPRIFELVCSELGVATSEAAFLDDIGLNCKAARALGMTTIKVADPDAALAELEAIVGFGLRDA